MMEPDFCSWRSRLQRCAVYTSQWRRLRSVIRNFSPVELQRLLSHLYWYDEPLDKVQSFPGLVRVWLFNLRNRETDNNAADYGALTLYYHSTRRSPVTESNPTVWNYRGLSNGPWPEPLHNVQKELESHGGDIIAEYRNLKKILLRATKEQLNQMGVYRQNNDHGQLTNGKRVPHFTDDGTWQGMYFYGISGRNDSFCQLNPKTTQIIEGLNINSHFGFVFYSELAPRTNVSIHNGASNLRIRCHIGVDVPEPESTSITNGGDTRHWRQNKCMFFDDSYEHEVRHTGDLSRVVLIIDLWHPGLTDTEVEFLSLPVFKSFGKYYLNTNEQGQ